jgi:hypothetical protein
MSAPYLKMGCLVSLGSESYKLPSVEFVGEL